MEEIGAPSALPLAALELARLLGCAACGRPLAFSSTGHRLCCNRSGGSALVDGCLDYEPDATFETASEMRVRDSQAHSYLAHAKFPIQTFRAREFMRKIGERKTAAPVLDLGCGPGPTTNMMLKNGYSVLAVDFSKVSLKINASTCGELRDKALFVRADLNRIKFVPEQAGGLMMADFLQHLGDYDRQREFLAGAFKSLIPGGWFMLSVFNANIMNRAKKDIDGSFAGGAIRYHRSTSREQRRLLPECAIIAKSMPMNIFNSVFADRLASRLPFARHLSRMTLIVGWKSAGIE